MYLEPTVKHMQTMNRTVHMNNWDVEDPSLIDKIHHLATPFTLENFASECVGLCYWVMVMPGYGADPSDLPAEVNGNFDEWIKIFPGKKTGGKFFFSVRGLVVQ